MTIVANMRLGTCRARFQRGLGASRACLGRILAALGPLLNSFWLLLGMSGAALGRFLGSCCGFCCLSLPRWANFGVSWRAPGSIL